MSVRSPHPEPASSGDRSDGSSADPLNADPLSADALIRRERPAPRGGWRRAVFAVTGGRVNPGDSKTEQRRQELAAAVRSAPSAEEHQSIAVVGAVPGVGATTVALALGTMLAVHRGDRSIAVDADAEKPPVTDRVPLKWHAELPLQDLIASPEAAVRFSDMNRFTAQTTGGLDVLASRPFDTANRPIGLDGFRRISDAVERHYPVQLVDAGCDLGQPALPVVLARATRLIVVAGADRDGASRAATLLDEVRDLGLEELAERCVLVLNQAPSAGPGTSAEVDDLQAQLAQRGAAAFQLPADPHFSSGDPLDPEHLRSPAVLGLLELAAEITAGYTR